MAFTQKDCIEIAKGCRNAAISAGMLCGVFMSVLSIHNPVYKENITDFARSNFNFVAPSYAHDAQPKNTPLYDTRNLRKERMAMGVSWLVVNGALSRPSIGF